MNATFIRFQWPWFILFKVFQVPRLKGYIYDSLCVCFMFHLNFNHTTHNLWETAHWKLNDLDLIQGQRSWGQLKHNILLHMCFIQTLVIRCTVYEMQPLENYVTLNSPLSRDFSHDILFGGEDNWKHNMVEVLDKNYWVGVK